MESKKITKVHIIASCILWLLGILYLLSQFATMEIYSLTGFTFLGFYLVTVGIELFAVGTLHLEQDGNIKKRCSVKNLILILLNIIFVVFAIRLI